jgi:hypothetical protein
VGAAFDEAGSLYVGDEGSKIIKLAPEKVVTVLAGWNTVSVDSADKNARSP